MFNGSKEEVKYVKETSSSASRESAKESNNKKIKPTKDEIYTLNDSFSRIVADFKAVDSIVLEDDGFVNVLVKKEQWNKYNESEKDSFLNDIHKRVRMSMLGANIIKPKDDILTKFIDSSNEVIAEKGFSDINQ